MLLPHEDSEEFWKLSELWETAVYWRNLGQPNAKIEALFARAQRGDYRGMLTGRGGGPAVYGEGVTDEKSGLPKGRRKRSPHRQASARQAAYIQHLTGKRIRGLTVRQADLVIKRQLGK